MTYNMTFTEDGTIPLGIIQGINDNSGGYFGGIILLVIFLMFLLIVKIEFKRALLFDSFLCTLLAGIFLWIGIIPSWAAIFPAVLLFISIFINAWDQN